MRWTKGASLRVSCAQSLTFLAHSLTRTGKAYRCILCDDRVIDPLLEDVSAFTHSLTRFWPPLRRNTLISLVRRRERLIYPTYILECHTTRTSVLTHSLTHSLHALPALANPLTRSLSLSLHSAPILPLHFARSLTHPLTHPLTHSIDWQ